MEKLAGDYDKLAAEAKAGAASLEGLDPGFSARIGELIAADAKVLDLVLRADSVNAIQGFIQDASPVAQKVIERMGTSSRHLEGRAPGEGQGPNPPPGRSASRSGSASPSWRR